MNYWYSWTAFFQTGILSLIDVLTAYCRAYNSSFRCNLYNCSALKLVNKESFVRTYLLYVNFSKRCISAFVQSNVVCWLELFEYLQALVIQDIQHMHVLLALSFRCLLPIMYKKLFSGCILQFCIFSLTRSLRQHFF